MADNNNNNNDQLLPPPQPVDASGEDDTAETRAAQGWQQLYQSKPVQQALDVDANLKAYQDTLHNALAGDKDAQLELANRSLGTAMGSVKVPEKVPESLKIRGKSIKDMTLSQLQIASLKSFPSSPIQKQIQEEIRIRQAAGEKVWTPPKETAGLPLDEASRLARAKKMGFDTDKVYYHGTPESFPAFKLASSPKNGDMLGQGVYLTDSPGIAETYAGRLGNKGGISLALDRLPEVEQKARELYPEFKDVPKDELLEKMRSVKGKNPAYSEFLNYIAEAEQKGSNILPVHVKVKNTFDLLSEDAPSKKLVKTLLKEPGLSDDAAAIKQAATVADVSEIMLGRLPAYRVTQILEDLGYDSIKHAQILNVFDPANIRSKYSIFDPAQAKSPKLSYAEGGEVIPDSAAPSLMQTAAAPQPTITTQVNVINPDGKLVSIPQAQLQEAVGMGYQQATPEHVAAYVKQQKYGTLGQQALTGLEGAAEGATFGASTALETGLNLSTPEAIQARRETNPGTHMLGLVSGIAGSALLGTGEGALLEKAGEAGIKALGLAAPVSTAAKIGSAAAKSAIENALFQSGDEVSKYFSKDPNQTVETALTDVGLSGLIGSGIGGGIGTVNPLWQATMGGKVGGVLKAIMNKAGGVEGVVPDPINELIQTAGIKIAPEVRPALSDNPAVRQVAETLNQSDTTKSGLAFQQAMKDARNQLGTSVIQAFGKSGADAIPEELSRYEAGKAIGNQLASDMETKLEPIKQGYDSYRSKFQKTELLPDATVPAAGAVPETVVPGTVTQITGKISEIAGQEGWTSELSDMKPFVNKLLNEVAQAKDLSDIHRIYKVIGEKMSSNVMDRTMMRNGMMLKDILRKAEADVIGERIGTEEGEEALKAFRQNQKLFKQVADIVDTFDSRLHTGSKSISDFPRALREMANTDGESVLRRLSGAGDADLLHQLVTHSPGTAAKVKDFHIDSVLRTAADKAKGEAPINTTSVLSSLKKMSPELRNFILDEAGLKKIDAVDQLLNQLNSASHNFSNTARTVDKLFKYLPSSAVGMATMLAGHNPAMGAVLGLLTSFIGKNAPDAVRLGVLKYLGAAEHLDAGGFKAMVDFLHSAVKGESLISNSTKAVFKAGKDVLPQSLLPTPQDRSKLDKQLKKLQVSPQGFENLGGSTAHYMPEHGVAMGQVAANAVNYLNGIRPDEQHRLPFDTKTSSPLKQAEFNRALDIAQQPLIVLNKVKSGVITPQEIFALKTMYPTLYSKLAQNLTNNMIEMVNKGETVPYNTRIGLSMFLGQPLDSTMTPSAILAAQPQPSSGAPNQPQAPMKHKTAALTKLSANYRTPGQAAEQHLTAKG